MVGGSRSLQMYTSVYVIHRWSVKTTWQQKTYCASDRIHFIRWYGRDSGEILKLSLHQEQWTHVFVDAVQNPYVGTLKMNSYIYVSRKPKNLLISLSLNRRSD